MYTLNLLQKGLRAVGRTAWLPSLRTRRVLRRSLRSSVLGESLHRSLLCVQRVFSKCVSQSIALTRCLEKRGPVFYFCVLRPARCGPRWSGQRAPCAGGAAGGGGSVFLGRASATSPLSERHRLDASSMTTDALDRKDPLGVE